ncbi:MAG: pyridoxamine kinase [Bacteroidales bacterium]|nr:pyridoxamine kinase [Bacteroidales bacterium]
MANKRVLAMQDLSCVGQCSLTVVSPILSALGVEACVLPTAILSNHTMFSEWSYLDLTDEMKKIFDVWRKQGFKFDAFLLGYLGKPALMETATTAFKEFSAPRAKKIIDPVFADNGKLYGGFDMGYVEEMGRLITCADVILPNVTEACFLTGMEYRSDHDKDYLETLAYRLSAKTNAIIVITGAEFDGKMGEIILEGGKISYVMREKLPKLLHGTGDIFAAAFAAKYVSGDSPTVAADFASEFVIDCIRETGDDHPYGACFETVLKNRTR